MTKEIGDERLLGDPGSEAFRLDKYPFYLLNRSVSRYNGVIEPRLREIGLDIPYWRVLMVLGERAPRGVRDLAEAAVIPLSTMTRIVQRMAASGLVTLASCQEDARVTMVTPTELGEARLVEARGITAEVFGKVVKGFSARDFSKLIVLLDRLYDNLL